MALVPVTGQAFGWDAHSIRACAGLVNVEQVEAHHLLEFDIASHFDVGPIPELAQAHLLPGGKPREFQAACSLEGSLGAPRELLDGVAR